MPELVPGPSALGSAARDRLAYALDYPALDLALEGARLVAPHVGVMKVGLELFVEGGPPAVRAIADVGRSIFLDLKLHDIEKTVERAVGVACQLGVKYLTLHTSGGFGMMEAAAKRVVTEGSDLVLLGVTVLTNLDAGALARIGYQGTPGEAALRLARLGVEAGLGGFVCSTEEVGALRAAVGPKSVLVTPGIRPSGAALGDQKRVGTPASAIQAGASLLVVGRPIRDASSPLAAAQAIEAEIAAAALELGTVGGA